jgi:hypothetical protein
MTFSTTRISDLGLICSLLGHKAKRGSARWNGSICFGRCGRCGCDLVRTVNGFWQAPRGYKVVWRPAPNQAAEPAAAAIADWPEPEVAEWEPWEPAHAPVEPEVPAAEAEPADQPQADPVVVVAEDDGAAAAAQVTEWPLVATPAPAAAPEAPPEPAMQSALPDFMDEASDEGGWDDFPKRNAHA